MQVRKRPTSEPTRGTCGTGTRKKKPKVLICYYGYLRTIPEVFESHKKHLIDPLDADVLLCVDTHSCHDHLRSTDPFVKVAKHVRLNEPIETPRFEATMSASERAAWSAVKAISGNWLGGYDGRAGANMFIMHNKHVMLSWLRDADLIHEYDWFVVTRTDLMWLADHPDPSTWDRQTAYVPSGQDWGGLNDRHIVCSSETIERCLDVLDGVVSYAAELRSRFQDMNAEAFLKFYLEKRGVPIARFPSVAFVSGLPGMQRRWVGPTYDRDTGMYFKYRGEMSEAIANANAVAQKRRGRIRE